MKTTQRALTKKTTKGATRVAPTKLRDKLVAAGVRPTQQRLALGALLFDGKDKHVTAEALHRAAADRHMGVSLATVYNSLHQFTEAGLLRKVALDASSVYFDTCVGDHHHFYDTKTGMLHDIPAANLKMTGIPDLPPGRQLDRVDVIIRLK
jgi:Fur family transcriptional regulator, iron response regulator